MGLLTEKVFFDEEQRRLPCDFEALGTDLVERVAGGMPVVEIKIDDVDCGDSGDRV